MTITIRIDDIQEKMLEELVKKCTEEFDDGIKLTKSDIIRMAINQYHYQYFKTNGK